MVPNSGGLSPPDCIQKAPCNMHHAHPVLCRTCREPVFDIAEVKFRTKEWHKQLHTISQVFKLMSFGIFIPRYTFHVLHYPIMIWIPIRVRRGEIPVPKLLTRRPPSSWVTKVGAEHSLHPLDSTIYGNTTYLPVTEPWVPPWWVVTAPDGILISLFMC